MNISPKDIKRSTEDSYLQDKDNLISSHSDAEKIKPFLSLKRFTASTKPGENQPSPNQATLAPASGQAIITYVIAGEAEYSDSTGKRGILKKDGWSWVIAGSGIWHSIEPITSDYVGVQVSIALSPALENSPPQSAYLNPELTTRADPAQVLIGWHGKNRSQFAIPSLTNYFVVHLKAWQRWSYEFPLNHQFAWAAVVSGQVKAGAGEPLPNSVTVFSRPAEKIDFHALTDSILVLGSALEFGHDLISHQGSVHTSTEALQLGLKGISAAAKI
jgi:redox-sensitive bicupin YhaK (pirin superfamily)